MGLVPYPLIGASAFGLSALFGEQALDPDPPTSENGPVVRVIPIPTAKDWPMLARAQRLKMIENRGELRPDSPTVAYTVMPIMNGSEAQKIMMWWATKAQVWHEKLMDGVGSPTERNLFDLFSDGFSSWFSGGSETYDRIRRLSPLVTIVRRMRKASPWIQLVGGPETLPVWPASMKQLRYKDASMFWGAIEATALSISAIESFGPDSEDWIDAGNIIGLTMDSTEGALLTIARKSLEFGVSTFGSTIWFIIMSTIGPIGLISVAFLGWWSFF